MHATVLRVVRRGVIPVDENLLALGLGEQRQCANRTVRIADDAAQAKLENGAPCASIVERSKRSLLYSKKPLRPRLRSVSESVRSNFAVAACNFHGRALNSRQIEFSGQISLVREHHLKQADCGSSRAPAPILRPVCRRANLDAPRRRDSARGCGEAVRGRSDSPDRSVRSTRVLTKKPIRFWLSAEARWATGKPTEISS